MGTDFLAAYLKSLRGPRRRYQEKPGRVRGLDSWYSPGRSGHGSSRPMPAPGVSLSHW